MSEKKEFWNERYARKEYYFGTSPNEFLKNQLENIPRGKILFAAEGEGRNAVYAAQKGFDVTAFDISEEAEKKAMQLALEKQVSLRYSIAPDEIFELPEHSFDVLALIYAHFPPAERINYHKKMLLLLKAGGSIIFEGFSKEQLQYNSGGPKQQEMLFSEEEVKKEFEQVDFKFLKTEEIELHEGEYHIGKASVVRFIGIKKKTFFDK